MRVLLALLLIMAAGPALARFQCTPFNDRSAPPEVYATMRQLAFDTFTAEPVKARRSWDQLMALRHTYPNAFSWSMCEVNKDEAQTIRVYEDMLRREVRGAPVLSPPPPSAPRPVIMDCNRVAGTQACVAIP